MNSHQHLKLVVTKTLADQSMCGCQVNGRLVLEGPLRVHWGVRKPIQLTEKDESPVPHDPREWRQSYCRAMANGLDEDFLQVATPIKPLQQPMGMLIFFGNKRSSQPPSCSSLS